MTEVWFAIGGVAVPGVRCRIKYVSQWRKWSVQVIEDGLVTQQLLFRNRQSAYGHVEQQGWIEIAEQEFRTLTGSL